MAICRHRKVRFRNLPLSQLIKKEKKINKENNWTSTVDYFENRNSPSLKSTSHRWISPPTVLRHFSFPKVFSLYSSCLLSLNLTMAMFFSFSFSFSFSLQSEIFWYSPIFGWFFTWFLVNSRRNSLSVWWFPLLVGLVGNCESGWRKRSLVAYRVSFPAKRSWRIFFCLIRLWSYLKAVLFIFFFGSFVDFCVLKTVEVGIGE